MRKNLKNARKALKLTQKEMAKKAFVSASHYCKIESGERVGDELFWAAMETVTGIDKTKLREIAF